MPPTNRGTFLLASTYDLTATSEPLEMMLITTGYTFDADHNTIDDGTTSDPASYEIAPSGYSRQTLSSVARFQDDTNDFAGLDAADVTFSSLEPGATIGAAVVYRYSTGSTTSDTGQDTLGYYALTATPTNGGDITIQIAATSDGGLLQLKSTS